MLSKAEEEAGDGAEEEDTAEELLDSDAEEEGRPAPLRSEQPDTSTRTASRLNIRFK